jgi:molybdenum cofactor cytidylyltransferase
MNRTAIIILAAGGSSRYGGIKQLLTFNEKSLLQHAIDEAINSGANHVVAVIGANSDQVLKGINAKKVTIVSNERWQQGMASSIVAGVKQAIAVSNDIENIIIAVCDQPYISADLFKKLYWTENEGTKGIVASSYADTIGTPVLFTRKYFEALMSLSGDEGAKKILKINADDVVSVVFQHGNIDIDTKQDYQELLKDDRAS